MRLWYTPLVSSSRDLLLKASKSIALAASREDNPAARLYLLHAAAGVIEGMELHWPTSSPSPVAEATGPDEEVDPFAADAGAPNGVVPSPHAF